MLKHRASDVSDGDAIILEHRTTTINLRLRLRGYVRRSWHLPRPSSMMPEVGLYAEHSPEGSLKVVGLPLA